MTENSYTAIYDPPLTKELAAQFRLHAAAPELLEALKEVVACLELDYPKPGGHKCQAIRQGHNAIALATNIRG